MAAASLTTSMVLGNRTQRPSFMTPTRCWCPKSRTGRWASHPATTSWPVSQACGTSKPRLGPTATAICARLRPNLVPHPDHRRHSWSGHQRPTDSAKIQNRLTGVRKDAGLRFDRYHHTPWRKRIITPERPRTIRAGNHRSARTAVGLPWTTRTAERLRISTKDRGGFGPCASAWASRARQDHRDNHRQ